MLRGRNIRRLLILMLALLLGFQSPLCTAQINVSEKQRAKAELQEKRKALTDELQEAKKEVQEEATKKTALDKQVAIVQQQIDVSNGYITNINKEIDSLEKQINEIHENMEEKIELLKLTLSSIYVAGDASTIDIILGAKNFEDFLDKADIVRSVSRTIQKLVDDLHADLEQIENREKEIRENKADIESEKSELEKSRLNLQNLLDESEHMLSDLQKSEREAKNEVDDNDEEIKAIEAQIKKFEEDEKRRIEREKRKAKEKIKSGSVEVAVPEIYAGGSHIWPVKGYYMISSGYFDTVNRGGRMHEAWDITGRGVYGAEVVASNSGTVILANAEG